MSTSKYLFRYCFLFAILSCDSDFKSSNFSKTFNSEWTPQQCTDKSQRILLTINWRYCPHIEIKIFHSTPSAMTNCKTFDLSIIHYSDFHARFVPLSIGDKNNSVGGIARIATVVKSLKQKRCNAILLNAGDCFTGSLYYNLFKETIISHFMNLLPHDAITIGNHEFDNKILSLKRYLEQLKAPIVMANVDTSREASLQNLWTNSTIIRRSGKNIGVIGVIFSDLDKQSLNTGNLRFLDELESVNSEAEKLKADGVDIIIVLSHCGIDIDILLANNCPHVDVIVGGHTHILLYNGDSPSAETVYGKYPLVITQKTTGKRVLIVHSGAYATYVGDLQINFNDKNEIVHWTGNPIYLDQSVVEDPLIVEELKPWKTKVDEVGNQVIGETLIPLNCVGQPNECTLPNLITDAMLDKYDDVASVSLMPATSVDYCIPVGSILYNDAYMTLPYDASWDLIELKGSDILQIVEDNMNETSERNKKYTRNYKPYHWSGLKVVYNSTGAHQDVVEVEVRTVKSKGGKYEALDKHQWYGVVVPSFLLIPECGVIAEKYRNRTIASSKDINDFVDYIKKVKVIDEIESRVSFVELND